MLDSDSESSSLSRSNKSLLYETKRWIASAEGEFQTDVNGCMHSIDSVLDAPSVKKYLDMSQEEAVELLPPRLGAAHGVTEKFDKLMSLDKLEDSSQPAELDKDIECLDAYVMSQFLLVGYARKQRQVLVKASHRAQIFYVYDDALGLLDAFFNDCQVRNALDIFKQERHGDGLFYFQEPFVCDPEVDKLLPSHLSHITSILKKIELKALDERDYPVNLCQDIDLLDEYALQQLRSISLVRHCRRLLAKARRHIRQFTVSIDSLPDEILGNIFLHCLSGRDDDCFHSRLFIITRVCRRWQSTAMAAPVLWSRINLLFFNYDAVMRTRLRDVLDVTSAFLRRSGGRRLFIRAGFSGTEEDKDLWRTLASESHRWVWLDMILGDSASTESFARLIDGRLPSLHCLRIQGSSADGKLIPPWEAFQHASSLSEVSLCGILPSSIALPWGLLCSLIVDRVDGAGFLATLSACSRLASFTADVSKLDEFSPSAAPHVDHLTLRHLVIKYTPGEEAFPLFTHLTLPCVESLTLENIGDGYRQERYRLDHSFPRFLERSNCPLRSLELINVADNRILADSLQVIPSLTTLSIVNPVLDDSVRSPLGLHAWWKA